jgi:hypothetical protein
MKKIPLGLLLAVSLEAQSVHLVGAGGFAQISDAIAVAMAGDVIEVTAGNYLPFTLEKALTIRGRPGPLIGVQSSTYATTRLRPPAGTMATISRIEFRSPATRISTMETRIERGTVFCEECLFEASALLGAGGLTVENATAVLRRCVLVGNGVAAGVAGTYNAGLVCNNAQVFASDCWLRGSDTSFDSYGGGGEGARVSASVAQFVRCTIEGGNQRHAWANPPGRGVATVGATMLWLADCTVLGGAGASAPGAIGLHHSATAPAQLARSSITGGPNTSGGSSGAAIVGATVAAPLLGLGAATMPLVRGSPFSISYRTQPNWPILVFVATDLQVRDDPLFAEPVLLAGTPGVLAILVADGNGDAVYQTTVPALPALPHARFFVEAVSGVAVPLHTSPPLGGVVR